MMDILKEMTISSSIVLILVMILKKAAGNRISPGWHMALWIIPAVRMTIPRLPESPLSMMSLLNINSNAVSLGAVNTNLIHSEKMYAGIEKNPLEMTILCLWISISILMMCFFVISAIRFRRKISTYNNCSDTEIIAVFKDSCEKTGVDHARFVIKTGAPSDLLAGMFRPVICIADGYDGSELKHVFIHELCHFKSKDIFIKAFGVFLICIYWFDPLVWIGFRMLCSDMEKYCDYRVIKLSGNRREYASVLLKSVSRQDNIFSPSTSMNSGSKEVAVRIKSIAAFKTPGRIMSLVMILLLVFMSAFFLTDSIAETALPDDQDNSIVKSSIYQQIEPENTSDLSNSSNSDVDSVNSKAQTNETHSDSSIKYDTQNQYDTEDQQDPQNRYESEETYGELVILDLNALQEMSQ